MKVSVLVITYNGKSYIKAQLDSIIKAIDEDDEIIISDDGSTDGTVEIIREYLDNHNNIKLVYGEHKGIAANFSNAYKYSHGEIIAFSDQDDEWFPEKITIIKDYLTKHHSTSVVMHNGYLCNEKNEIVNEEMNIFIQRNAHHGVLHNIIKSTYYGCCMAFRREFLNDYMPLSPNIIAYDQFLGLCAENKKCSGFIEKKLIKHRLHDSNQSKKLSLIHKSKFRFILILQYFKYRR